MEVRAQQTNYKGGSAKHRAGDQKTGDIMYILHWKKLLIRRTKRRIFVSPQKDSQYMLCASDAFLNCTHKTRTKKSQQKSNLATVCYCSLVLYIVSIYFLHID